MGAVSGKEPLVNAVRACYSGDEKTVLEFLRQHPYDTDVISPLHNHTMLYGAARNGRDKIVDFLLNPTKYNMPSVVPANINLQCGRSKSTALHASSYYGKLSTVLLLKTNGADPNIKNIYGYTPVQEATKEVLRTAFADLQNLHPHMNELEGKTEIKGYCPKDEGGSVNATITKVRDEYDHANGTVAGVVGDKVAQLFLQVVMMTTEKFYPTTRIYDVQPNEFEVSWQQVPNVGLSCTVSFHLVYRKDKQENLERLKALQESLRSLRGLVSDDWKDLTIYCGVPMELKDVSTQLARASPKTIEHLDLPHPYRRDESLRTKSYKEGLDIDHTHHTPSVDKQDSLDSDVFWDDHGVQTAVEEEEEGKKKKKRRRRRRRRSIWGKTKYSNNKEEVAAT